MLFEKCLKSKHFENVNFVQDKAFEDKIILYDDAIKTI